MSKRKLSTSDEEPPKKQSTGGHWSMGLLNTMKDPKYQIKVDELVTVIKDMYPKAKYHYLILCNEAISNLKALDKSHVKLLKHMEKVASELINDEEHKDKTFKIGYHAEPSMTRLHLHVISDDMNSQSLKTKKHWNSFTTDFFLNAKDVRKCLKENGKVILPSKDDCKMYLATPLKCHKCDMLQKHIPALKRHIQQHE